MTRRSGTTPPGGPVRPPRRRRLLGLATLALAVLALFAAARASVTMIYLGFTFSDDVDPITEPVSYYVFSDGGGALFNTAAVALAVGVLAVLVGMAWAGVRMAGRPTVLFSVWALCLILAAIFPADDSPDVVSVAGWIHQFAGAGILALLSFAGLAAAPRLAESPAWRPVVGIVRTLSVGAAVLATAYVLGRVIPLVPLLDERLGWLEVGGMLQRMVFAFDIGVVAALAVHLVRVSWLGLRDRSDAWLSEPSAPLRP